MDHIGEEDGDLPACAAESEMSSAARSMPPRPIKPAGEDRPRGTREPVALSSSAPL